MLLAWLRIGTQGSSENKTSLGPPARLGKAKSSILLEEGGVALGKGGEAFLTQLAAPAAGSPGLGRRCAPLALPQRPS